MALVTIFSSLKVIDHTQTNFNGYKAVKEIIKNADSYATIRSKFKRCLSEEQKLYKANISEHPENDRISRILTECLSILPSSSAKNIDLEKSIEDSEKTFLNGNFELADVTLLYLQYNPEKAKSSPKKKYNAPGIANISSETAAKKSSSRHKNIKELLEIIRCYNEKSAAK
jgi:hypothetical protein